MAGTHKNKEYFSGKRSVNAVEKEFLNCLHIIKKLPDKIITILGSHALKQNTPLFKECEDVCRKLGEKGFAIMSGGGPGIMQAANTGAMKAGAGSIGVMAKLLEDEKTTVNIYTEKHYLHYMFARKFLLHINSDALIFFPGGIGTLDELFEYLVLMSVGITETVPMICYDRSFWSGLFTWIEEQPLERKLVSKKSLKLVKFADSYEEIAKILKI